MSPVDIPVVAGELVNIHIKAYHGGASFQRLQTCSFYELHINTQKVCLKNNLNMREGGGQNISRTCL